MNSFKTIAGAALIMFLCHGCFKIKNEAPPLPKPNILWLLVEDISPNLGCYGDTLVRTPHIDALSKNGMQFNNVFMPAPVCSSVRSALITGAMPTTFGTHNHHSSRTETSAISLPDSITTLPQIFKRNGYYTFNQGKDDYNFAYHRDSLYEGPYRDNGMYGKVGTAMNWSEVQQPYFGQIQLYGNKYIYSKDFKNKVLREIPADSMQLPPYYPETDYMKQEWASYLESIELTDQAVGASLEALKKAGMLQNTYVFFFSDHGMRLWRHKQFLYEGGIKVPLLLTYFDASGQPSLVPLDNQQTFDDLVSGLDISASSLDLAGIQVPDYYEGQAVLSKNYTPKKYVYSVRDRCDFSIDRIRSVRSQQFKYIRNFKLDRPAMQGNYRDAWDITKKIRKDFEDGKLDTIQAAHWQAERAAEELYDLANDPHETINLAQNPSFQKALVEHRNALTQWIQTTQDQGQNRESIEGLQFMYSIWGDQCTNPEYNELK